jgi:hypothetical protein
MQLVQRVCAVSLLVPAQYRNAGIIAKTLPFPTAGIGGVALPSANLLAKLMVLAFHGNWISHLAEGNAG